MKKVMLVALALCALLTLCRCAPVDQKDSPREAQSAFVPAFDEIVVESSLTVRRKNDAGRQGRNKNAPKATTLKPSAFSSTEKITEITKTKRHAANLSIFSAFNKPSLWQGSSTSISDAHAQANNVNGLLGSFGSSATHSQSQTINFSPYNSNGFSGSANIAATQHYYFPTGMKIDVNFATGNSFSRYNYQNGASSSVVVTHPSNKQQTHYNWN